MNSGQQPVYSNDSLRNILFPIGGLGTGDILLGGRGNIEELEIFGKPAIDSKLPDSPSSCPV